MKKCLLSIAICLLLVVGVLFCLVSCGATKTIESANVNEKGELILTYTDGSTENLGVVKGDKGDKGEQGDAGNDENPQGLAFFLKDDGTYAVEMGYAKYLSKIEIPATYNGKPVTEIGNSAFSSCTSLTSITIPNSVTSIGYNTFEGCTSLESATTGIVGYGMFKNCF